MNNVEKFYVEAKDVRDFARQYFKYLGELLGRLDVDQIAAFAAALDDARRRHATIFVVGNGGSAATASHLNNDIATDVYKKGGSTLAYRVMSLTDNIPVLLAIANDDGYENIFVNQLRIHYREGDMLIAISASGNSENVVRAAQWVKDRKGLVAGLTGFGGGKLRAMADCCIHVPSENGEYGPVEDIHMIMDHLLANWFQYKVRDEGK